MAMVYRQFVQAAEPGRGVQFAFPSALPLSASNWRQMEQSTSDRRRNKKSRQDDKLEAPPTANERKSPPDDRSLISPRACVSPLSNSVCECCSLSGLLIWLGRQNKFVSLRHQVDLKASELGKQAKH